MKLSKLLFAIAMPLVLSAGCAMDVGSSSEGLTADPNSDFGINECGQSTQRWLDESQWPVDSIVAGDMEFTRDELVDYIAQNPGARSALIAEIAAAQLNMTVALEIPDGVIEDLVAADDFLMAPADGILPPIVDDFGDLSGFNNRANLECFTGGGQQAEGTNPQRDLRNGIVGS